MNFSSEYDHIATINGKLTDTGWATINTTYPTYMRVKNGFVTIDVRLAGGTTPSSGTVVYTLPAAYAPPYEMAVPNSNASGYLFIKTDGSVVLGANTGQTINNYFTACITFPI
jgi:hypothetical protein